MTKVFTMPIELYLAGSAVLFLVKTTIYVIAACVVVNYASKKVR